MAKQPNPTKRTISYPIDQKIKDLHELIVKDRENPKVKELQADVDWFYFGYCDK